MTEVFARLSTSENQEVHDLIIGRRQLEAAGMSAEPADTGLSGLIAGAERRAAHRGRRVPPPLPPDRSVQSFLANLRAVIPVSCGMVVVLTDLVDMERSYNWDHIRIRKLMDAWRNVGASG